MTTATATTRPANNIRRLGTIAALAAGVALLTKVAVIVITANTAPDAVTTVLYFAGVALPLMAAAAIASGRPRLLSRIGVWVAVVLAHLFFITTLSDSVGSLVEVFTDQAYLTDEIPLAVLGLIWLIVGLRMHNRASDHH